VRTAPIELYDITTDPGEQVELSAKYPDVVKRIGEIMQAARTDSKEFPVREGPAAAKPKVRAR
jgi:hypothetical protein